jgi:hypothetical protein
MRAPGKRIARLLAILAVVPLTSAATFTPAVTSPTSATSPDPATPVQTTPPFAPSPRPTAVRQTPLPSATPERAADVDPTPVAIPDVHEDEGAVHEVPSAQALPTSLPAGPIRAFRTPEREAPPAFVAPRVELPEEADDAQGDEPATESMPPLDTPYVATVTFRAVASTELDGFELMVIYPRAAGDFVGNRNAVDCRKTGDATMFADDQEGGTLRLLVASPRALGFPFDIVCRFTVEPNAVLHARNIAVNVVQVSISGQRGDTSALTVSVSAR